MGVPRNGGEGEGLGLLIMGIARNVGEGRG